MDARRSLAIGLGAMVGAVLRWSVTRLLGPDALDAALLVVNVAGCAALGYLTALVRRPAGVAPAPTRRTTPGRTTEAFLGAGLCGSLTTWSSLALTTAEHLRDGAWATGGSWLAVNLVVGLAAAVAGRHLAGRAAPPAAVTGP